MSQKDQQQGKDDIHGGPSDVNVQVVAGSGKDGKDDPVHVPLIELKPALGPIGDLISRKNHKLRAPWRRRLGRTLESTPFHAIIVLLLLIDLLVTSIDIVKVVHSKSSDLDQCTTLIEECQCVENFEHSEHWEFLYWISISILSVLALNIVGLLVAFGGSFFFHPGYVLDFVVVGVAMGLEIGLDSDAASLLIILTLWRIVRVAHGIFEVTDSHWEKEIKKLEQQIREAEATHVSDQERIAQLEARKEE